MGMYLVVGLYGFFFGFFFTMKPADIVMTRSRQVGFGFRGCDFRSSAPNEAWELNRVDVTEDYRTKDLNSIKMLMKRPRRRGQEKR